MNIQEFAEKYRLRLKKDSCGDLIVLGRLADRAVVETVKERVERFGVKRVLAEYHSHVYDGFNDGKLGVYLGFASPKKYGNARRALLAAGCEGKQAAGNVRSAEYPTDGCLKFDPTNDAQAELVIALAGLKRRKVLSDAARQAASDRMRDRFKSTRPHVESPLDGKVPTIMRKTTWEAQPLI